MKIGGVTVKPCEEILVLPRQGGDLVIRARAANINAEFEKLCPEPIPPMITTKDGKRRDYTDEDYKRSVSIRDSKRFAYMVLKSIESSQIEWSTVDMLNPDTWMGWSDEMMKEGLAEIEITRIVNTVLAANALDEEKIKQAREAFLRGQGM